MSPEATQMMCREGSSLSCPVIGQFNEMLNYDWLLLTTVINSAWVRWHWDNHKRFDALKLLLIFSSYNAYYCYHWDFLYQPKQSCNEDLRRLWRSPLQSIYYGQEPVSIVHYTRPRTCINRPLHLAWIQYQAAQPKLISYTMPCKLACHLPWKNLQNHIPYQWHPPKSLKNLRCNSVLYPWSTT